MSNLLRLAIVDPADQSRDALKAMLLGMEIVWLEAECSRYEFFADVVSQTNSDVGIISLDHDPQKGIALIERLRDSAPECAIVVLSRSTDGETILRAMRAGAKEFLTAPVKVDEMVAAMERIAQARFGRNDGRTRTSTIVAVCGASGGVGTTSLAVNLGCVLAKDEVNQAALVDLDLALGDADVFLDSIPDYTLVDVAQNINRLDFTLLKRSLTKHSSGLYLLPRPVQLQDTALVQGEDFQRIIGLLKATFTHLIVDTSKSYTELDLAAMNAAKHVLLVTQLDLPCLRNVVRLLMSFEQIEGLSEKVKIIVNRSGLENGQISIKKAQETIGREIFWKIPNDYRTMIEVRNNGVPLIEHAPKAGITQAIVGLAGALCGPSHGDAPETEDAKARGGWLGLFGGKKTPVKSAPAKSASAK